MSDTLDIKHELGRKAIHLTSLVIIFVFLYFGKEIVLSFLAFALVIILTVEYFRIDWGFVVPLLYRFFRLREREVFGGEVFFIIGAFIAISVFSPLVALAAILMTTFGDMAAALFGKAFGRHRIPKIGSKTYEGSLAEFCVNILIGFLVLIYLPQYLAQLPNITTAAIIHPEIIILIMATTATFVETAIRKIDDNLLIPIFTGSAAEFFIILFRWLGV